MIQLKPFMNALTNKYPVLRRVSRIIVSAHFGSDGYDTYLPRHHTSRKREHVQQVTQTGFSQYHRALCLYTSTPPHPYACSVPSEPLCLHACTPPARLHTSYSLHEQHASRALEANTSTSLRLQRTSRPLLRQRPQARSMPPELQISIRLHLP